MYEGTHRCVVHTVYGTAVRKTTQGILPDMSHGLVHTVVFLGSFLLFTAELMLSKRVLPLFGGSASVWTGALMLFTALVVIGYAYGVWITQKPATFQRRVHSVLVLASVASLPLLWSSPAHSISLVGVVCVLVQWIAFPFVLLATGTSLMHSWHPSYSYRLYALSNAGSFAALVLFPFVFEPMLSMPDMRTLWVIGYVVWCAGVVLLARHPQRLAIQSRRYEHMGHWALLASIPTALLASATAYSAQMIAPMPLVWMLPLAAYLASFIVAFAGYGNTSGTTIVTLAIAAALWALDPAKQAHVLLILFLLVTFIFVASVRIHARLYSLRPVDTRAASFYLAVSLGGFLGTGFVAIVCPIIFSDYFELPLLVTAAVALGIFWLPCGGSVRIWTRAVAAVVLPVALASFLAGGRLGIHFDSASVKARNFYGVTTVAFLPEARVLLHGRTLHGMQLTAPDQQYVATTYYSGLSGVGRAVRFERSRHSSLSVGVVGLGVGTLAVYCAPGDAFTFYEIDPRIVRIATTDFTYLDYCPHVRIATGDARLSIANAVDTSPAFDLMVLDAFDGDAIPVHLLTREALATYGRVLASSSAIIAFHISNRMLDLAPQVVRLAQDGGYASMVIRDQGDDAISAVPTVWVLLARDSAVFTHAAFAGTDSYPPRAARRVWTDEYASLLSALRW